MYQFTFSSLTNAQNFVELKRQFVLDELRGRMFENKHTADEIHQDYYLVNFYEREKIIESIANDQEKGNLIALINKTESNFNRIYVTQALPEMVNDFVQNFSKTIHDKAIYGTDSLIEFKSIKLQELNEITDKVEQASYLDNDFKATIIDSIEKAYHYINYYKHNTAEDKIKFNLNKNEVVTLFHLLLKKGYIKGYKADLSRFIDANFQYLSGTEGIHKDITSSGKLELKLKSNDKNPDNTYNHLKEIFTSEDMYSLE